MENRSLYTSRAGPSRLLLFSFACQASVRWQSRNTYDSLENVDNTLFIYVTRAVSPSPYKYPPQPSTPSSAAVATHSNHKSSKMSDSKSSTPTNSSSSAVRLPSHDSPLRTRTNHPHSPFLLLGLLSIPLTSAPTPKTSNPQPRPSTPSTTSSNSKPRKQILNHHY